MRKPAYLFILFACIFLMQSPAHAAQEPRSSMGNVDCGTGNDCTPKSCESDAECTRSVPFPAMPGGLAYGCLTDAHVCGWLHPQQPQVPQQ